MTSSLALRALSLMCVGVASGCATTATLTKLQPASADVSSVRRLTVLYCAGPEDSGPLAHNTIVSTLAENSYYSLVDPAELERFAPGPLYDLGGKADTIVAIEAARRMRLDAILIPRVRYRREGGLDLGGSIVQIGDPTVTAAIHYQLIDVRTGHTLAKDRTTASYKGELTDDRTGPTSRQKVLAKLVREAAAKAARKITPHRTQLDVCLAGATFGKGSGAIRQGNKLAVQGDWANAMESWQSVLVEDPKNAAALYNLGVACEATNDFDRARSMYSAAGERSDNEMYRAALARVEQSGREYQVAVTQIHRADQRGARPPMDDAHAYAGW